MVNKKRFFSIRVVIAIALISSPVLVYSQAMLTKIGGSFSMFNGADLSAWTQIGNAGWIVNSSDVSVTQGQGMLVSKLSQPDLLIDFDYWVGDHSQASLYFRCSDPNVINSETAYEIILVDQTKNNLGAGSIVNLMKMKLTPVSNQWNHMQISGIGNNLSITLNGSSSQIVDTQFAAGPFAIAYRAGGLRLKNLNVTVPGRW